MDRRKEAFQRLKPSCVRLSQAALSLSGRTGSAQNVNAALDELLSTLRPLSDAVDDKLAEYVFFPLSHVFKESKKLPVRCLELSLQCLSILLTTGWRAAIAPNLSAQLVILLSFLGKGGAPGEATIKSSEECQVLAFDCLGQLFRILQTTEDGRRSITATANIPALGHTITVLLDCVEGSESTSVQLSALACLGVLCSAIKENEALASFLPGITSSLTKVLTPSTKQRVSYKVLKEAVDIISLVFQKVLNDDFTASLPPSTKNDATAISKGPETSTARLDQSWLKAASGQVKLALANIARLRQHPKEEVQVALSKLCLVILQQCRKSLADSTQVALETLIVICVRGKSERVLAELKHVLTLDTDIVELLRKTLHDWIQSLPRIVQGSDESAKQQRIQQISLSIRLLSEQNADLRLLDRLLATKLRDTVMLTVGDTRLIESASGAFTVGNTASALTRPDTGTRHFGEIVAGAKSQAVVLTGLGGFVDQLGSLPPSSSIAKNLTGQLYTSNGPAQVVCLWLSLRILRSSLAHSASVDQFLDFGTSSTDGATQLLDTVYSFSLSVLTDTDPEDDVDWRLQALALEGVAMQAQQNGEDFQTELVDALYPVVHLLGSSIAPLRQHAMTALNVLSKACGYQGASEMIVANVDYMVNAVSLKLNAFDISPQAPQVLLMMVKLTGPSLLPFLDDLVASIFSLLDNYHGYPKLVELLFSVLRAVSEEGTKAPQLAIAAANAKPAPNSRSRRTSLEDVVGELKTLQTKAVAVEERLADGATPRRPWKEEAKDDTQGDEDEEGDQQMTETPDPPPPAPKTYSLLLKISELTQHYLPSSSPELRGSLLALLDTTFPALAKHENSFLPLINTLWPVLLPRLDDLEPYVVASTLDVITSLCRNAGDFMRTRMESAWLMIKSVAKLKADLGGSISAATSTKRPSSSASFDLTVRSASAKEVVPSSLYEASSVRMIRESVLGLLASMVANVRVDDEIFGDALEMSQSYLEEKPDLRQALEMYNPDAVWLALLRKKTRSSAADISTRTPVAFNNTYRFAELVM